MSKLVWINRRSTLVIRKSGLNVGKLLAISTLAAGAAVMAPGKAHAAVHFYTSTGAFQSALSGFGYSDENVLFNDGTISMNGNPVRGKTNMTGTIVSFL